MFFRNARVILFKPKDGSTPPITLTRVWWSNDESDYSDYPSNGDGTFNNSCFPEGKYSTNSVKIEFGTDVNSIADNTFTMGSFLTNIIISNTVRTIDSWAFASCENLTTITIPDSVTTIGEGAFSGCNITNVTIVANGGNAANVR
jgi:hypothetical protein